MAGDLSKVGVELPRPEIRISSGTGQTAARQLQSAFKISRTSAWNDGSQPVNGDGDCSAVDARASTEAKDTNLVCHTPAAN
jgi:hypothetical protein